MMILMLILILATIVSQVGNGHNWCSPYKQWQVQYMNDPFAILENQVLMMMMTDDDDDDDLDDIFSIMTISCFRVWRILRRQSQMFSAAKLLFGPNRLMPSP